jgi:hypothetical protein
LLVRFENEELGKLGLTLTFEQQAALINMLGQVTREQLPDLLAHFGLRIENGQITVGLEFFDALAQIYTEHQQALEFKASA